MVLRVICIFFAPAIKSNLKKLDQYANFEYLAKWQLHYNNLIATVLFFIYIKLFKYLSFNKTMGQLNNTLKKVHYKNLHYKI